MTQWQWVEWAELVPLTGVAGPTPAMLFLNLDTAQPSTVNMVYTQPQELAQSVLTVHTAHLILADMTHMVTRYHTQVFPHLPHFQLVVPGLPPLQPAADFKLGR